MPRSIARRSVVTVALALAPVAALMPTTAHATAHTAATAGDGWHGKYNDFLSVDIIRRDSSHAKAEAVITYVCAINGQYSTLQADLKGKIHKNKIKFHGPTLDQTGKAHIHATLTKPKAKVSITVDDSQGSCSVFGDFKAKFKRIK